ncbi:MAG: aminotransferase class V-fold PLP-dependent enzyme [candidate division Zixibacteria bacterium]|nr:aminotransferase class V-fold PLP-dependent enzyme [candidate division Zixibacteria bacterium]
MKRVQTPIYMDHHATTPVDQRVLDAMLPFFTEQYGNAASTSHVFGWTADEAVERARRQVAEAIGATPQEIVFTSGATESNNLAIKGLLTNSKSERPHLIVSAIEHRAVLDPARHLAESGCDLTIIPVNESGIVNPGDIARAMTDRTVLISIMTANNEVGTIQPIREIGCIARERGVLFHTDAAQAIGHIPVNVDDENIDLLSISAHKVYGPKGIGALYIRRRRPRIRLNAQIDGGGHERRYRSGTLPVPLIVGLGTAMTIAVESMSTETVRLAELRDHLKTALMERIPDVVLNGAESPRLPHNLNLSFAGMDSESVLTEMRDIALSSGSACSSAEPEASHVLRALGYDEARVKSSIRFGLGRANTSDEVDYVVEQLVDTVNRLRRASPRYRVDQHREANHLTTMEQ